MLFILMDCKSLKVFMSTDMIPMNMGRCHYYRQRSQFINNSPDISNSQTGIDQKCLIFAAEQITVCLLPVAIFTDGKSI